MATATTSETMMTTDHNYSLYSADNDGQQQSQVLGESNVVSCTDELILPPPSCWFTDDLSSFAVHPTENYDLTSNDNTDREQKHEWTDNAATAQVVCSIHQRIVSSQISGSVIRKDSLSSFARVSPSLMKTYDTGKNNNSNFQNTASFRSNPSLSPPRVVAAPSPSWKEISSQVLPSAAKELLSSSMRRICYTARLSYSKGRWHRKYSEIGNNSGGYFRPNHGIVTNNHCDNQNGPSFISSSIEQQPFTVELPPFSSLPWVDRQMVQEWRTYLPDEGLTAEDHLELASPPVDDDADTHDFDRARTLVPQPIQRPLWQKADICHECLKPFGPTRLRHHCRLCGYSFCQLHSGQVHLLPHLGYEPDVPERVCDLCKRALLAQNLAERVAWRLARCRDLKAQRLTPYFETGIDTVEEAALRMAHMALATARSIPLGAQAHVAVETVEVLRKHGLNGIYGIMLRQEFLAAADLLRKALGINRTAWPLSVHELSAAIFYALAQHRAMRGIDPDREEIIHTFMDSKDNKGSAVPVTSKPKNNIKNDILVDHTDEYNPTMEHLVSLSDTTAATTNRTSTINCLDGKDTVTCTKAMSALPFTPVCSPVADGVLNSLISYAPIALTFIYAPKEVEMQLLAAQQGWKLLYACLNAENEGMVKDMPASAVFVHEQQRTACLAVRGTATIHDVVTDVRQMPVSFPEADPSCGAASHPDGWTNVTQGNGLAVCGMASAAMNLFREHIDVILHLVQEGYRIRIAGHSLGGGVATLLGVLIIKELEQTLAPEKLQAVTLTNLVRVYAYGSPSCVDETLAKFTESFVTTVVLHDDVVPRLTPTSCRGLLKHLLHIRETWVKAHLTDDLFALGERASLAWAPRWRSGFTLASSSKLSLRKSSRSIKRYCQKKIERGTKHFLSVKEKLAWEAAPICATTYCEPQNLSMEEKKHDAAQDEVDGNQGLGSEGCTQTRDSDGCMGTTSTTPKLLVEMMGGVDSRTTDAVIIDDDEFFDADDTLIESDEESLATTQMFADALDEARSQEESPNNKEPDVSADAPTLIVNGNDVDPSANSDEEGPGAVVLDEIPLPRMFIPGNIVHIYSHRGTYKAAFVPRAFRELRRISLAGNMLADHTTSGYYESLLEVRSVRHGEELPPRWTAYDEDDTCSCCASRFTWASTSDSAAQEARDKHNCRSCGTLVCNPCSSKSMPLPSIGVTVPVRVCDRCYHDLSGILTGGATMRNSFLMDEQGQHGMVYSSRLAKDTLERSRGKPERYRERRSVVVDDLARRIKQSALANS